VQDFLQAGCSSVAKSNCQSIQGIGILKDSDNDCDAAYLNGNFSISL